MPLSAELITIGLSAIAAIVWLVRLEGRVNTAEKVAAAMDRDLAATNARAEAEAKAHRGTADALIRVEEQLKYVRELLERHFVIEDPAPRRRRTGGAS
jgi:glycyl-tRNA synthetase beta subunit